jgi:hypothetical protein
LGVLVQPPAGGLLERLEIARRILAEAKTLGEAKQVRDVTEGVLHVLKRQRHGRLPEGAEVLALLLSIGYRKMTLKIRESAP